MLNIVRSNVVAVEKISMTPVFIGKKGKFFNFFEGKCE
jgi:hypothetical protein